MDAKVKNKNMAENEKGFGCFGYIVAGLIILVFSIIRGCNGERKMYDSVIELNTDSVYIKYLNKYHDGVFFKEVDSLFWIQTLNSQNYTLYVENLSDSSHSFGKYVDVARDSIDEILWREAIKSLNYQNYLNKSARREYISYCNSWITIEGKYETIAKDSITQMSRKWKTDDMAWNEATRINNSFAYNKYLALFPNGRKVQKAKKILIDIEVDDIFEKDHGELPKMDKTTSQMRGITSNIIVYNNTSYTLTLRYSGTESKIINIPSQTNQNITLTSGHYRIAASVNTFNVRNYAGTQDITGGNYNVEYYIKTR